MTSDTSGVRRGLLLGSAVGLLNACVAIALAWWFGHRPHDFGWYSYTPLTRHYADYGPLSTTPGWKIALVCVLTFLVVNTGATVIALAVTRRHRRTSLGRRASMPVD